MITNANDYAAFLGSKTQHIADDGFEPLWMPDWLIDFQQSLTTWAIRKGRALIAADCGLGKTPMQLVWSENVVRKTNGNVLILAPLAVSHQTIREGEKFGIEVHRSTNGKPAGRITVTNYERLRLFDPSDYAGCVCDEGSILKHFDGAIKKAVTEFMHRMSYRLIGTATAAPNDYFELGTVSEALGYLGYSDMLTRFFKEAETQDDYLGWGRKTYRFRGHAEQPFWRWVCSWARVCRKPSDLGFEDGQFVLPPLTEEERLVENSRPRAGFLLAVPAKTLSEQREERRVSMDQRCDEAARLVEAHDGSSVVWCHLNPEGDAIEKAIDGAVQVKGSQEDEEKEEILVAFQRGEIKTLVTKPKIGCFGLNWQHCHNVVTFPSHSWEQYYQAVRRCWRFGQKYPVHVTIISTEGEQRVLRNLQRKAVQADSMFTALSKHANAALGIVCGMKFNETERLPQWL